MFPALNLSKHYIIFDVYFINNFLFWRYKYEFEFFNKGLNIDNSSNYNVFSSSIPMNSSNCSSYLIKKSNIMIYK
jgi:hypothetical protein